MLAEFWTILLITLSLALYLHKSWRSRVKDSSGFYVAGQDVPQIANGAATAAIAYLLTGNPIPQLAFTFSDIVARLNQIQLDLGFQEYSQPFANRSMLDVLFTTLALMLGTAGLPHVIVRFYTVPNVRAARYSAGWALLFIALLYTSAPALATFARYNLISTLHNQPIASVHQLDWVNKWEKTKLLTFEDKNNDGRIELTADKSTSEISIDPDIIVLSTPEVAKLAPWVIGFVAAGGLAAALSTASGLLLVISSSIAHDIYYRIINPNASETQRVFVGPMMVGLAVVRLFGFSAEGIGTVGMMINFVVTLIVSRLTPPPPIAVQKMIQDLRSPAGAELLVETVD